MGVVYRAIHSRLKRPVAIKVLRPGRLDDPRALARFEREMEAVARLDHPNIVRALDAGEDGGRHYFVMQLVEGLDLARLLASEGPLPRPRRASWPARRPWGSSTPTSTGSSTATSSRRTSSSTAGEPSRSSTWASPARRLGTPRSAP